MSTFTFKLPDVGEGVVEAEIVAWHVKQGDAVKEDQHIADVMTDKATVELTAPVAGTVMRLSGTPGDSVAVGSELIVFETDPTAAKAARSDAPASNKEAKKETKSETKAKPEKPSASVHDFPATKSKGNGRAAPATQAPVAQRGGKPLASPAVRRRAMDSNIDLARVPGSGPAGRIRHEDLDAFIASGGRLAPMQARAKRTGTEEIRIIGLRRKIAEHMQHANQIPQLGYVEEVDVTELEALRQFLNAARKEGQAKLTLLPFLMAAMVKGLRDFPHINATFDSEAGVMTRYDGVHIGIATQTPGGLMVPVVRHAEALDVWESAAEVKRVADAARDAKATREELTGSTITITSLGALGGIATMPIINAPEVAIVGVNKMVDRPMVVDGQIAIRTMMNLSACCDHRVVDGYDTALFIQAVKAMLEHPATIFM